jgi:hypothetical protein
MFLTRYCIKIRVYIGILLFLATFLNLNAHTRIYNDFIPKNDIPQLAILSTSAALPILNCKTEKKNLSELELLFSFSNTLNEISKIRLKSYSSFLCRKINFEQKLYPFLSVYFSTGT